MRVNKRIRRSITSTGNRNRGFTFAELMIVFGLSAIVIGIIMTFWVFWERAFSNEAFTEGAVHQDVRLCLQKMVEDFQNIESFKEFKQSYISFTRFSSEGNGRKRLNITWEIGSDDRGKPVIRRIEDRDEKIWVGRGGQVMTINEDVFQGYTQNVKDNSFDIFDTWEHDTGSLAKITMIRINLHVLPAGKTDEEDMERRKISFRTRVGLRYIRNRLVQPHWNFK